MAMIGYFAQCNHANNICCYNTANTDFSLYDNLYASVTWYPILFGTLAMSGPLFPEETGE